MKEDLRIPDVLKKLADNCGGTITEVSGPLPDDSGFAIMSMPLPKDHWSLVDPEKPNVPPMRFRMGERARIFIDGFGNEFESGLTRQDFAQIIREAGRYAYRCATMNGKEPDLDPDALIQNLVVALLGYWINNGLSSDEGANPPTEKP
jgi:hypothetical protein